MQVLASLMMSPTPSIVFLKHTSANPADSRTQYGEPRIWNLSHLIRVGGLLRPEETTTYI